MIKKISWVKNGIKFINSKNNIIQISNIMKNLIDHSNTDFIKQNMFYKNIISFVVLDEAFIASFEPFEDSSPEFKRRNVIKFNEDGEILWVVEDKMKKIWEKRGLPYSNIMEELWFENLHGIFNASHFDFKDCSNKIIADESNGYYYSIDIDSGEVEFLKALKD